MLTQLPLRSILPCETHNYRVLSSRKIKMGLYHNTVSCDQGTAWQEDTNFVSMPV